jgi:flagellar protein FlaJ
MGLFDTKPKKVEEPAWDAPDPAIKHLVKKKARTLEQNFRIFLYTIMSLGAVVALVFSVMSGMEMLPWHKRYATDFFLVALVCAVGPYAWFYNREMARLGAIDGKFPDFLRDLAESARAGMTLPRALVNAAGGAYGELTPEIKKMAAQVEWGVEFSETLQRFGDRVGSPLIRRIVSLIVEAQRAGGSMVEILSAAADDAREIKQIVQSRNNQMGMYSMVIYIAFFVFIAVVLVLQAQFIPAFKTAVDAAGAGAKVGGLNFKQFDPEDFNTIFFHAALIQGMGGGLVGGVLTKGNAIAGMRSVVIMMIIAWVSFRIVVALL